MTDNNNEKFDVDRLLNSLFKPVVKDSLSDLFLRRVEELKISATTAEKLVKIERRTLKGILTGKQKLVDFTNLIKLANFLQIPKERVTELYIQSLEKNFPDISPTTSTKVEFIRENFDLVTLKRAGFIENVTDFGAIEKKIVSFFGLKEIFDYHRPPVEVAFSSGLTKPKNELTRAFWINTANNSFEEIDNPFEYNREALIKYFPQIRWHSTSVDLGMKSVIRDLFKLGITVYYVPPLPSLHLRGATFAVNDKPCVALTDYVGFYPTLWFALVHELFHVLFDWEEISTHSYHVSDDENDQLAVREKEKEADNFAREYLFSKEKTAAVKPYLNDTNYITEFAADHHVDPSFIYVFNAKDMGNQDRKAWARAKRYNPDTTALLKPFDNRWDNSQPIIDFVKSTKFNIYK